MVHTLDVYCDKIDVMVFKVEIGQYSTEVFTHYDIRVYFNGEQVAIRDHMSKVDQPDLEGAKAIAVEEVNEILDSLKKCLEVASVRS